MGVEWYNTGSDFPVPYIELSVSDVYSKFLSSSASPVISKLNSNVHHE
jgi:hypothetical protein